MFRYILLASTLMFIPTAHGWEENATHPKEEKAEVRTEDKYIPEDIEEQVTSESRKSDPKHVNRFPENVKVYIIPQEVKCKKDKNRITHCTDKAGTPITGLMHKYREDELIRTYEMTDGVLNGKASSYYVRIDQKYSEKNYKEGRLNGESYEWHKNGVLKSVIPYVEGRKEGIYKAYDEEGRMREQAIYIGGKLNGPSRIYATDKNIIFDLNFANNQLQKGTCLYQEKTPAIKQGTKEQRKLIRRKLSKEEINKINAGELSFSEEIGEGECQFYE